MIWSGSILLVSWARGIIYSFDEVLKYLARKEPYRYKY
jgi:hypothetical protein